MNTLTIFLQRSRNTWMIRTMISARNFCHGQMNFLQNAGNNTEIKPLRRADNYSGGDPPVERLHSNTHNNHLQYSKISPVLPKQVSVKRKSSRNGSFSLFLKLCLLHKLLGGEIYLAVFYTLCVLFFIFILFHIFVYLI